MSGLFGDGDLRRTLIIAEAGVNHNGDEQLAHRLVEAAAGAGVDAVKFQTFIPELVASAAAEMAEYQQAHAGSGGKQLDMLRALDLPRSAYAGLMASAGKRGLLFLSTAFERESADFLAELGMEAFKVPSGELTNHPFLRHLAAKGMPLLISTGMATLEEVEAALEVARGAGARDVAILHCVSSYPADPADCNLKAIGTMQNKLGVPVGWSDHTEGITIACAAVALGARVIEKHLTLDRTMVGPDHALSLEPAELAEMVRAIRKIEQSLGDGCKRPTSSEQEIARLARRSLHWRADFPIGHRLQAADLVALRPGTGIPPARAGEVEGRVLKEPVAAGEMLRDESLEG